MSDTRTFIGGRTFHEPKDYTAHMGPIFANPDNGHVYMAKIEYDAGRYRVGVWNTQTAVGFQTPWGDRLVDLLWEATRAVLASHNVNIMAALEDVKVAILTLTQEMDRKVKDEQLMLARLGQPTLIQSGGE